MPKIQLSWGSILASIVVVQSAFIATARSAEFPVQARLYAGMTPFETSQVNAAIDGQGLKKFDKMGTFGAEITVPLYGPLRIGGKYLRHTASVDQESWLANTDYEASVAQDTGMLVLSVGVFESALFRFDLHGGVGISSTKFKVKTATQDADWKRVIDSNGMGSVLTTYGASASIGYKWVYLNVEAGFENNKVDSLEKTGTSTVALNELDFSGQYILIGLLFDGIPGSVKK